MKRRPPGGLICISPGDLNAATGERFVRMMAACVEDGFLRAILLREPRMADGALLQLSIELCSLRDRHSDLWVAIHDRPHLALAADADAVHLGFRSLRAADARRVVEDHCAIGLSTHVGDRRSRWADADYLFHGPVYDTPSKRGLVASIGETGLAEFCASVDKPVWAIGGLEPFHANGLRRCGARGAAVLRGISCSPQPVDASRTWHAAWNSSVEAEA